MSPASLPIVFRSCALTGSLWAWASDRLRSAEPPVPGGPLAHRIQAWLPDPDSDAQRVLRRSVDDCAGNGVERWRDLRRQPRRRRHCRVVPRLDTSRTTAHSVAVSPRRMAADRIQQGRAMREMRGLTDLRQPSLSHVGRRCLIHLRSGPRFAALRGCPPGGYSSERSAYRRRRRGWRTC